MKTHKDETKGVRLRPDQSVAIKEIERRDPEFNFSLEVRRFLDRLIRERLGAGYEYHPVSGPILPKRRTAGENPESNRK
jgi:hypothetical protein